MLWPLPRRAGCALLLAILVGACASAPPGAQFPKTPSAAFDRPLDTRLGALFERLSQQHGGYPGFKLFPAGIDGFALRLQMVHAAQRSVDVQYYLLEEDATGRLLIDALLHAADRGVRVRLILDDLDARGRDDLIGSLDAHPNIEVRVFNPFAYRGSIEAVRSIEFLLNASRLDYRMHNKLFVVDGAVAVAGGRNVANTYFQLGRHHQLGDYDIFAAGPVVPVLSASFDAFWNCALAIPVEALRGHSSEQALARYRQVLEGHLQRMRAEDNELMRRVGGGEPLRGLMKDRSMVWAPAQVLYDSPDKRAVEKEHADGSLVQEGIETAAANTEEELLMISAYLVPGPDGMDFLERLRQRNIQVGIVTNSLGSTNEVIAHSGYVHYRMKLLEWGITLHEVRARPGGHGVSNPLRAAQPTAFGLHGKAFVFDRRRVYIGSMNFDERSLHLNTELGLLIESPVLARQVAAEYAALAAPQNSYAVQLHYDRGEPRLIWVTDEHGQQETFESEPGASVWRRLGADLLSLLPLDGEL